MFVCELEIQEKSRSAVSHLLQYTELVPTLKNDRCLFLMMWSFSVNSSFELYFKWTIISSSSVIDFSDSNFLAFGPISYISDLKYKSH